MPDRTLYKVEAAIKNLVVLHGSEYFFKALHEAITDNAAMAYVDNGENLDDPVHKAWKAAAKVASNLRGMVAHAERLSKMGVSNV